MCKQFRISNEKKRLLTINRMAIDSCQTNSFLIWKHRSFIPHLIRDVWRMKWNYLEATAKVPGRLYVCKCIYIYLFIYLFIEIANKWFDLGTSKVKWNRECFLTSGKRKIEVAITLEPFEQFSFWNKNDPWRGMSDRHYLCIAILYTILNEVSRFPIYRSIRLGYDLR